MQAYNENYEPPFNRDPQPDWRDITDEDRERALCEIQRVCDDAKEKVIGED